MDKDAEKSTVAHVAELLSDPLTRLVMRADRVDEERLIGLLSESFAKLGKGAASSVPGGEKRAAHEYRANVGVMLINDDDLIFVGKRKHTSGDAWQMPQGGIEDGEEPLAAAFRELNEEIGTSNARVVGESQSWLFYDWPRGFVESARNDRWRGQRQKWFAMRFSGKDSDINIETATPEFSDWRWVSISALPDLIVPFKRLVYLSVLEEFRHAFQRAARSATGETKD